MGLFDVMYDRSTPCPKGPDRVHSLIRDEGKMYVCRYCGVVRVYDPETGTWM